MKLLGFQVQVKGSRYLVRNDTQKFTLNQISQTKWNLSWQESGIQRKARITASSFDEALKNSINILEQSKEEEQPAMSIVDGCTKWVKLQTCSEGTKQDYIDYLKYFLSFLDAEYPKLKLWSDLRLEHLKMFSNSLLSSGKSRNTIRLYTLPIRFSSKFFYQNDPDIYKDFAIGYKLPKKQIRTVEERRNDIPIISFEDFTQFIFTVFNNPQYKDLAACYSLQCLMSLRVEEVLRLTWNKINLTNRTIRIEDVIKNEYSIRELPMSELVYQFLMNIEDKTGKVCKIISGKDAYRNRLTELLNDWKEGFYIAPKDLRNTLPSTAETEGWGGIALEAFLGHSPNTMTGKHYVNPEKVSEGFKTIVERVDGLTLPVWKAKTETKTETEKVLFLKVQ